MLLTPACFSQNLESCAATRQMIHFLSSIFEKLNPKAAIVQYLVILLFWSAHDVEFMIRKTSSVEFLSFLMLKLMNWDFDVEFNDLHSKSFLMFIESALIRFIEPSIHSKNFFKFFQIYALIYLF